MIKYQVCLKIHNWYIILILILEMLNCRIKGLKMLRFPSFLQVNFQMFENFLVKKIWQISCLNWCNWCIITSHIKVISPTQIKKKPDISPEEEAKMKKRLAIRRGSLPGKVSSLQSFLLMFLWIQPFFSNQVGLWVAPPAWRRNEEFRVDHYQKIRHLLASTSNSHEFTISMWWNRNNDLY